MTWLTVTDACRRRQCDTMHYMRGGKVADADTDMGLGCGQGWEQQQPACVSLPERVCCCLLERAECIVAGVYQGTFAICCCCLTVADPCKPEGLTLASNMQEACFLRCTLDCHS